MAYDFTGSTSEYLYANAPVTTFPWTMACWAWMDAIVSSKNTLLSIVNSGSINNFWQLYTDNSSPPFVGYLAKDSSTFTGNLSNRSINLNTWNLIGVASSGVGGDTTKIWVNGSVSSQLNNAITPSGLDRLTIGLHANSSPQQAFNGAIGEVMIWNAVLTSDDWAALAKRIDPHLIKRSNLKFYRNLIRPLNSPSGPGVALTNIGSVGVRTHLAMRYKRRAQRIFPAAESGPVVAVPGDQTGTFGVDKVLTGVSVSSELLSTIRVFVDAPAVVEVTLSGGVVFDSGGNDENEFVISGSPSALNTVIGTLKAKHAKLYPTAAEKAAGEYPLFTKDVFVTITGKDSLGAEDIKSIKIVFSRTSGVGNDTILITGNETNTNKALDPADGGIEVNPSTGFVGASEMFIESVSTGGLITRSYVGVIVEGSIESQRNILAGNLNGVLQGVI